MLSNNEFIARIINLTQGNRKIPSKTKKAFYSGFRLEGNKLFFYRDGPNTDWAFDIRDLWEVYSTQEFINTSVVKKVLGGRTNSPMLAILIEINCIDEYGRRI